MKKYLNCGIALSICLLPGLVMAAVFVPPTGDFSVALNWSTVSVPGAGELAEVYGKECIVTTTESLGSILMATGDGLGGSYVISAGGNLTATAQALIGNEGEGSLLVDGGDISIGTEFAIGVGGGATGAVTINSGTITGLSLLGVGWAGGTGTCTINGGTVSVQNVSLGSFGGNGTLTITNGTLNIGNALNCALNGWTSVINVEGGVISAGGGFNFAPAFNWGTQTLNLNGGQMITAAGDITQAAGTTFNIGFGELIFGEASVEDVNGLIDSGDGIWNFLGIRSVATNFAGGVIVTSLPIPPTGAPTILSSSVSNNVMKLVIDAPGLPEVYYPEASSDLVSGGWGSIPHSDDGVNPFVVTNLGYSTTDATGTNEVIYLETDQVNQFFKIMGDQP